MFAGAIGVGVDDFGCCLSCDGEVEFVLYYGIEVMGGGGVFVIVDATFGEDVGDLLPDASFAGTDGADSVEEFAEVVFAEGGFALF